MLAHEAGTGSGSDIYFFSPSSRVRKLLYYATSCGYYYTDYDYHIKRDYREDHLLFYIFKGRLSIRCGDETEVASDGQVCLLNCHKPHEYYTIGHAEFIWMHINGPQADVLLHEIYDLYGSHVFYTSGAEQIKDGIYSYIYANRNKQIVSDFQTSQSIYGILLALLAGTPKRKNNTDQEKHKPMTSMLENVMLYIGKHYHENISVRDIADHVNMSQSHFSRLFKKQSGYSPHEYLIQVRMNRAKHLLKTSELSVKAISKEVGYQDVTTFIGAFTNYVGISPTKFRKYQLG